MQRLTTDNEQPNSAFEQTSAALSAGAAARRARRDARLVFRLDDSTRRHAGRRPPSAAPTSTPPSSGATCVGSLSLRRSGAGVSQQLGLAYARTRQLSLNPLDSGTYVPEWNGVAAPYAISDFPDPAGFQNQTARAAASYQVDLALGARHLLTAGAEAEHETGEIGNRAERAAAPGRARTSASTCRTACCSARAPT